jgi:hypothetical protein
MTPEERFAKFKRVEFEAAQTVIDAAYAMMAAACRDLRDGKIDKATADRACKKAEAMIAVMTRKREWE